MKSYNSFLKENNLKEVSGVAQFKGPLDETGDNPYSYVAEPRDRYHFQNKEGIEYLASFAIVPHTQSAEFAFAAKLNGGWTTGSIGNTSDSLKIFSTIGHILKTWWDQHPNILDIVFSASKAKFSSGEGWSPSNSRVKLYDILAVRLAKEIHAKLTVDDDVNHKIYSLKKQMPISEDGEGGGAPTNSAGGGAIAGIGVGPKGEPGVNPKANTSPVIGDMFRRKAVNESEEMFGGHRVFLVDTERFHKARLAKRAQHKYTKYVGDDEIGDNIRTYGRSNPGKPILLKDKNTGAMQYLKYGRKDRGE